MPVWMAEKAAKETESTLIASSTKRGNQRLAQRYLAKQKILRMCRSI